LVYVGGEGAGNRGVIEVLSDHGDYDELARILKPAVTNPKIEDKEVFYSLYGDALYRLGRRTESQAAFANLLGILRKAYRSTGARTAQGRPAQLAEADAQLRAGDLAGAVKSYEAVRRLYPDFAADAANSQAYLNAEDGVNLAQDLKLAQYAVGKATTQDDPEALAEYQDTLGWVYYQMWLKSHTKADIEQAVSYLELGVSAMPQQGDCVYHLATAYEANGQIDDARIEFERLANLWPANTQVQAEIKRLGAPPPKPSGIDTVDPEISV